MHAQDSTARLWDSRSHMCMHAQDGTARLWDSRSAECVKIVDPAREGAVASSRTAQLKCLTSPYVSAVKFDSSGSWLICGSGSSQLALWSMTLGTTAKQIDIPCVPQVGVAVCHSHSHPMLVCV